VHENSRWVTLRHTDTHKPHSHTFTHHTHSLIYTHTHTESMTKPNRAAQVQQIRKSALVVHCSFMEYSRPFGTFYTKLCARGIFRCVCVRVRIRKTDDKGKLVGLDRIGFEMPKLRAE
jgi:hypothetical protein